MAKFLNTSGTNYFLEEMIRDARDRLILVSPYLKLNDRVRELLSDKNRLKIDVRIVYGKSELQPQEISWLKELSYVRTSFCKNLHAKCYLNEELCIITSLNLYEFSQVNNNEMGILIRRSDDPDLYREAYEEAQRIIRISEEVRISLERIPEEKVEKQPETKHEVVVPQPSPQQQAQQEETPAESSGESGYAKLTTSKLALKLGLKTDALMSLLVSHDFLEPRGDKHYITQKGKAAGGEFRMSPRFGAYFLWPENFQPS